VLVGGITSAQYDPGIPDTVSFGAWEAIVPADSPWTGNIRVPVRVFNDEPLTGVELLFRWSGPWKLAKATFTGKRASYFSFSIRSEYESLSIVHMVGFVSMTPGSLLIPPDSGVIAYLCFSVLDTGEVEVDSTETTLGDYLHLSGPGGSDIFPIVLPFGDIIHPTTSVAGDINNNGELNMADIVALANYVFKHSFSPPILNLSDVNADCRVDLVDVVYLVNVILRSRFVPQFGCAC